MTYDFFRIIQVYAVTSDCKIHFFSPVRKTHFNCAYFSTGIQSNKSLKEKSACGMTVISRDRLRSGILLPSSVKWLTEEHSHPKQLQWFAERAGRLAMAVLISGGPDHGREGRVPPTDCAQDALEPGTAAGAQVGA